MPELRSTGNPFLDQLEKAHHRFTYRGVPCWKNPLDLALYQMLIHRLEPELVLEIGTALGGSALYLADLMDNGVLTTIDPNRCPTTALWRHPRISHHSCDWRGFSVSPTGWLVIDDGSHEYEDVAGALAKFQHHAAYYVVEDTAVFPDANRAVEEFLAEHPEWQDDRELANFWGPGLTFNRWLKRS